MPSLFDSFMLKDITLKNRIAVSPMCQYSAEDGVINDWHLVHLGAHAIGGAGLIIGEATAVSPEGRITPGDSGIWTDAQAEKWRPIVAFLKKHGAVPGLQIAHAGRKASANKPWEGDNHMAADDPRAWQPIAPSANAFGANLPRVPRAMTKDDIVRVRGDFVAAAKRALAVGFEWLELHYAHGYLAQSFFSPLANKRTDDYGGSFENRIRFLVETFAAVREVWPARLPLTVRLGISDFKDGSQTIEESIELIKRFKSLGLDLIGPEGKSDLLAEVRANWLPAAVVAWGQPDDGPLFTDRPAEPGLAYVCEGRACQMPAADAATLAGQLEKLNG